MKFFLFGYREYNTHNGGMNDYRGAFDTMEEAKAAILAGEFNCYDIAWVNSMDALVYTSYWKDQRWLTADEQWTDIGFENNPVRWVNMETRENLEDGQILRTPMTYDELVEAHKNDPGKESNPLPWPTEDRGMRGTYHKDTGLFYCIDDHQWYNYKISPNA